jgi:hypothetical protein
MSGSIREPQQIERRRTARVLRNNCRPIPQPTSRHKPPRPMFWNLNQTEKRKTERTSSARNNHLRTVTEKPAESNRDTKLLEITATPRKHSTATHSNRDTNPFFTQARSCSTATPGCVRFKEIARYRPEANEKPQPRVAVLLTAVCDFEFRQRPRERGKNSNRHPQFLFRLERGRIDCFQALTHCFN